MTIGSESNEKGYGTALLVDGTTLSVGTRIVDNYEDIWLIRSDWDGNVLNKTTFGGQRDDIPNHVNGTIDGGSIIIGRSNSYSYSEDNFDIMVYKMFENMSVDWMTRISGGIWSDYGQCVRETADGGYVLTGFTSDSRALFITYLNETGSVEWMETYGKDDNHSSSWGDSIIELPGEGYVACGRAWESNDGMQEAYVIHASYTGEVIWERYFRFTGNDTCVDLIKSDTGVSIIGISSESEGDSDVLMFGVNASGSMLWSETFGWKKRDEPSSVVKGMAGGLVISGFTSSKGSGHRDAFILKTSSIGAIDWTLTLGGTNLDEANSCVISDSGKFFFVGSTESFGNGKSDLWLGGIDIDYPPLRPDIGGSEPPYYLAHPYNFTSCSRDIEGEDIRYVFSWDNDDETETEPLTSGLVMNVSHSWLRHGLTEIMVKAVDPEGHESDWSVPIEMIMTLNDNPIITNFSCNRTKVEPFEFIDFMVSATDNEGHDIKFKIDWGNENTSSSGFLSGQMSYYVSYRWEREGTYQVSAFVADRYSARSEWVKPIEITININDPPSIPAAPLGTRSGDTGVPIDFTFSGEDPDGDIIRFHIDWGDGTNDITSPITSGGTTTLPHVWIKAGIYDLVVRSEDEKGLSTNWTDPVSIEISDPIIRTAPSAPVDVSGESGKELIRIVWTPPDSNGGALLTGYKIKRKTKDTDFETLGEIKPNQLWFNDSSVLSDTEYIYIVIAINDIGDSTPSNEVSVMSDSVQNEGGSKDKSPGFDISIVIIGIITINLVRRYKRVRN